MKLVIILKFFAAAQFAISIVNLFLTRLLGWKDDIARMPLLVREVFHVHAWFISVTLLIFAVMTWRFADEMAAGVNDAAQWLAACIGIFWGFRTVLQVTYYSSSHWRGQWRRTAVHVILLALYGGMAATYLFSAFYSGGNGP